MDVTKVNVKQIAYKHSGLGCGVYYSEFITKYQYSSFESTNVRWWKAACFLMEWDVVDKWAEEVRKICVLIDFRWSYQCSLVVNIVTICYNMFA